MRLKAARKNRMRLVLQQFLNILMNFFPRIKIGFQALELIVPSRFFLV